MLRSQLLSTPKQTHRYFLGGIKQRYITITSEFDSGNLGQVKQISDFSYRITSACDCSGTPFQHSTRSWFYFSVEGFPPATRGRFLVNRVNILWSFVNSKMGPGYGYHPVYNNGSGWRKLEEPAAVYENINGEVEIMFDYLFREGEQVRFAITYPYEYGRCVDWVAALEREYRESEEVYFQKEVLVRSLEERDVYLLTITDRKAIQMKEREDRIEGLFPDNEKERPWKDKKPVILISARVHPGETPSSYALQGMINFLLKKDDLRSQLLRKFFTFKIVPMLNPDGVHNGNYRMDMLGQNLNRYYNNTCTLSKQPSIFALKSLMQFYSKDSNRMMFYFDLHAHPARKGCFVYGNALSDFVHQVENYVFCKLMAMNTTYFEYQCCNFSKKHMKAKDRYEELTKEGCGRVFAYRCSGMIHSFTLELGYHFTNNTHSLCEPANTDFKYSQLGYSQLTDCSSDPPTLTPKAFTSVGQSLLISVLDLLQRNPFSRLANTEYCTLDNLRRLIAFQVFHQDERFRMFEIHTYTKVKHINELIEESFYAKIQAKFGMGEGEWPDCVRVGAKESTVQREGSGYKHSSSCLERVQLPEIRGSPNKIKGRSFSVKKEESEREDEKDEPQGMDSVQSSDESQTQIRKTQTNQERTPAQSLSPDPKYSQKAKLRLLNLKLTLAHSPLQQMIRFSEGNFPDTHSCSSFSNSNNNSNRQVKQVNLTFQQNFIVLPNVGGQRLSPIRNPRQQRQPPCQPPHHQSQNTVYQQPPSTSPQKQNYTFLSQPTDASMLINTLRQVEMVKMLEDEQQITKEKRPQERPPGVSQLQLREQLMKEMEYFKKEIKEQFSRDIKKEVSDQINRNSFVRSYLKSKKNIEYAKSRKNKFFPNSEKDVLSVSSIKPQDRPKLLKLPSIGK